MVSQVYVFVRGWWPNACQLHDHQLSVPRLLTTCSPHHRLLGFTLRGSVNLATADRAEGGHLPKGALGRLAYKQERAALRRRITLGLICVLPSPGQPKCASSNPELLSSVLFIPRSVPIQMVVTLPTLLGVWLDCEDCKV